MTEPQPFRVGIVGTCPQGRFLVECLSLQPDCELLAFAAENQAPDELVRSLELSQTDNWQRFLSTSDLAAVLFLDTKTAGLSQIQEALDAGLPVGVVPPLDWEPTSCKELGERAAGRLFVLNPHHEDADFRAARQMIQTGALGFLSAIKRISWVADLVKSSSSQPSGPDTWFSQLIWEDLDQLLLLAGEFPRSVYAADYAEAGETYHLIFHFPSGLIGHVERRRGSIVPLDVGWTISGEKAGYANGRRYIKTEAGEIYDVPAEADPISSDPIVDSLRRMGRGNSSADSSWQQAVHVVKVRHALIQSAKTGQITALAFD